MSKQNLMWILIGFAMAFLVGAMMGESKAEVLPSCDYKPNATDVVTITCGSLEGQGSVGVRICGINYTIPVVCHVNV